MERCNWCLINDSEIKYHDEEWGVPVHDDIKQFEYLMLEVMQCGLNWDLVLKKRPIFRKCFDNFDYNKIATYDEAKIEEILNTENMIRSRRKIEAVIHNARCFLKVIESHKSFSDYLWAYSDYKTILYNEHDNGKMPVSNGLSDKISKDLKKKGFKYLGSITIYSHLQACGIINDHVKECDCYKKLISKYPTVKKRRYLEK